jgi:hypothetical protein
MPKIVASEYPTLYPTNPDGIYFTLRHTKTLQLTLIIAITLLAINKDSQKQGEKNMANLNIFCKALNWQGGTIHQVSEELSKYLGSKELCKTENLIKMNESAVKLILAIYKTRKAV